MRRYDFPQDRFTFSHWLNAPVPAKLKYWYWNYDRRYLTISLTKNDKTMNYDIGERELYNARNWRLLVARAVRLVRKALRENLK